MPKSRPSTRDKAAGGPAPISRHYRIFKDLVALINDLRERGVEFVSLTEAIDTTTPMGSFIFHITAALAELERSIIKERTRAGLASARARDYTWSGCRVDFL